MSITLLAVTTLPEVATLITDLLPRLSHFLRPLVYPYEQGFFLLLIEDFSA